MQTIKVKCPAKINLTLEILNKREDGFHNIQSVMQTIDLFDILTISVEESEKFEIKLSGTSDEIPYNEKNLVHKAILLFVERTNLLPHNISVHIEKNIPIAAGLAGGSTDAAGTLWALNEIFENKLTKKELHQLCAKLGSDLNFCLEGGCQLATSRGEILEQLPFKEFALSLIKPKKLGISAKEAYTKFSELTNKPNLDMTTKLVHALKSGNTDIGKYLHNDLEIGLIDDYEELKKIKSIYPFKQIMNEDVKKETIPSIMSGSGSTFFVLDETVEKIDNSFWTKNNLKSINYGVIKIN